MRKGTVFTCVCLFTSAGQGVYPHPADGQGGTPSQAGCRGTPFPGPDRRQGVGVPLPRARCLWQITTNFITTTGRDKMKNIRQNMYVDQ